MKNLINEYILVFCVNYIYTGVLKEVTDDEILLSNCAIVYETGAFDATSFVDAQKVGDVYIRLNAIESFGKTEKR